MEKQILNEAEKEKFWKLLEELLNYLKVKQKFRTNHLIFLSDITKWWIKRNSNNDTESNS